MTIIAGELKEKPIIFQDISDRQLLTGDCLRILKSFPKNYFDLIYLDPPFNSKEYYNKNIDSTTAYQLLNDDEKKRYNGQCVVFRDMWTWDTEAQEMFDELTTENTYGSKISTMVEAFSMLFPKPIDEKFSPLAYYIYMIPRLFHMHRVLSETGSIYLHCDPYASHYLKIIMDTIFGYNNFMNEIIWHYGLGAANRKDGFLRKHDVILYYSKSGSFLFNKLRGEITPQMKAKYCHEDKDGKYMMSYNKKYYLKGGKPFDDVWDIPTLSATDSERLGYPTQKPEALLECIILASSNKGSRVLDPFCGGGTTLDVAERLDRKYTGIDISKIAKDTTLNRLSKYKQKWNFYKTDIQTEIRTNDGEIICSPKDLKDIDNMNPIDVECLVRDLLNAEIPPRKRGKNGTDGGIDGLIRTTDNSILINIALGITTMDMKSSGGLGKFNQFPTNMDNNDCKLGIFISNMSEGELTPSMKLTVKNRGFYKDEITNIIQVISFNELLNAIRPRIPGRQISPEYKEVKQMEYKRPIPPIENIGTLND